MAPGLASFPLVKGTTTYPFALTTVPAWAWTAVKTRLNLTYRDPAPTQLLMTLKEYLQDTVRSTDVHSFEAYDHSRIVRIVDDFFAGNRAHTKEIDWWLAFDLWRKGLRN